MDTSIHQLAPRPRPKPPRSKSDRLESAGQLNLFRRAPQIIRLRPSPSAFSEGASLEAAGKFDEAAAAYARAVEIGDRAADALNNLGAILLLDGENERAAGYFGAALRRDPAHAEAHYNLACGLINLGETRAALVHLEWCLATTNDQALESDAYYNLVLALALAGRLEDAERWAREARQRGHTITDRLLQALTSRPLGDE